jgi:MFS family permease
MSNTPQKHDPYAALRIRDFRLLVIGRLSNTVAFMMIEVVMGWQIYALTKDPLSLGLVGLVSAIPSLSISLYAGHLSDNKSRRKIGVISLLILFLSTLSLFGISLHLEEVYNHFGTLPIYSIIFIMGLASGFLAPAMIAFSYQLIPQEVAPNAAAWRSSTWQAAAIAGPALGGMLFGFVGASFAYMISAVLMSIGILCFYFIPERPPIVQKKEETIIESLKQGIRFVFRNQIIVGAFSLDLFAILFGGAVAMLPVYASDILKIGPEGLGLLRASPAVGAVITALWMAHRPMHGEIGKKLFFSVIGFGVTIIIFGISLNPILSVLMLAAGGAFDSISVIFRSTLLQLSTPNEIRGRVESVNMMFIGSSNEIGAFESGVAAKLLGVIPSVIFGGCMTLLSVGVTSRVAPVLRNLTYEQLLSRSQIQDNIHDKA